MKGITIYLKWGRTYHVSVLQVVRSHVASFPFYDIKVSEKRTPLDKVKDGGEVLHTMIDCEHKKKCGCYQAILLLLKAARLDILDVLKEEAEKHD